MTGAFLVMYLFFVRVRFSERRLVVAAVVESLDLVSLLAGFRGGTGGAEDDGRQQQILLIACPEVAHFVALPAPYIVVRTPGGVADPSWGGFQGLPRSGVPTLVVCISHTNCRFHKTVDDAKFVAQNVWKSFRDSFRPSMVRSVSVYFNDETREIILRNDIGGYQPLSLIPADTLASLIRAVCKYEERYWAMPKLLRSLFRCFMTLNHPRTQRLDGIIGSPSMRVTPEALPPVVGISFFDGLAPLGLTEKVAILDHMGQGVGTFREQVRQLTAAAFQGVDTPTLLIGKGYCGEPQMPEIRKLALADLIQERNLALSAMPALPTADNLKTILALYDHTTGLYEIIKS